MIEVLTIRTSRRLVAILILLHAAALDGMGIALLPSWQTDADLAAAE